MNEETPLLTQPSSKPSAASAERRDAPAAESAAPPPPPSPPETPEAPEPPVAPLPGPSAVAVRPALPGWLFLVLLALLIGVLALAWHGRQLSDQVSQARSELAQRLSQGDDQAGEAKTLARETRESLATLQGRVGAIDARVAEIQGQASAFDALYDEFSRSRDDRALAEVEHALSIAVQQLQLAGNLDAALIALQGAEARLSSANRPQYAPLRVAIGRDLEQVRLAPRVDVSGLSLRLEQLLASIDALPLAYTREALDSPDLASAADTSDASESIGGWMRDSQYLNFALDLGREVWRELRQLVRIERMDQPAPVLLAPEQGSYLRENVKIRLLTARLALLARDGRGFTGDLQEARQWVEQYFDGDDEAVRRALREMQQLADTSIRIEMPVLTESLSVLRSLQARQTAPSASTPSTSPIPTPERITLPPATPPEAAPPAAEPTSSELRAPGPEATTEPAPEPATEPEATEAPAPAAGAQEG